VQGSQLRISLFAEVFIHVWICIARNIDMIENIDMREVLDAMFNGNV
jgi:hypothetical protein